ncbi:hypothetical protein THH46_17115 [Pseudomonas sp. NA13]
MGKASAASLSAVARASEILAQAWSMDGLSASARRNSSANAGSSNCRHQSANATTDAPWGTGACHLAAIGTSGTR